MQFFCWFERNLLEAVIGEDASTSISTRVRSATPRQGGENRWGEVTPTFPPPTLSAFQCRHNATKNSESYSTSYISLDNFAYVLEFHWIKNCIDRKQSQKMLKIWDEFEWSNYFLTEFFNYFCFEEISCRMYHDNKNSLRRDKGSFVGIDNPVRFHEFWLDCVVFLCLGLLVALSLLFLFLLVIIRMNDWRGRGGGLHLTTHPHPHSGYRYSRVPTYLSM